MKLNKKSEHWPKKSESKSASYSHVSFFDLDHTLLKVNSSFKLGVYFYQKKFFSTLNMLYLSGCYGLHKIGLFSIPQVQQKIFRHLFLGTHSSVIAPLAAVFLDEHFEKMLNLPVVQLLRQAQEAGHWTVILSSSPDFLVKLIAERLNVDAWESTRFEVDRNKRFCRISRMLLSQDKARYVGQVGKRWGIAREKMTAYSDSILDLEFLESVGCPVAVNPDRALRAVCKQNDWLVL